MNERTSTAADTTPQPRPQPPSLSVHLIVERNKSDANEFTQKLRKKTVAAARLMAVTSKASVHDFIKAKAKNAGIQEGSDDHKYLTDKMLEAQAQVSDGFLRFANEIEHGEEIIQTMRDLVDGVGRIQSDTGLPNSLVGAYAKAAALISMLDAAPVIPSTEPE